MSYPDGTKYSIEILAVEVVSRGEDPNAGADHDITTDVEAAASIQEAPYSNRRPIADGDSSRS